MTTVTGAGDGATAAWLKHWADEPYAYLTTTGRRTGRPHRIKIWFSADAGRIYLLSGGRDRSDWVRNLQANPRVLVELGDEAHRGMARVLPDGTPDDRRARELLVSKYGTGHDLAHWGQTSLGIAIEFPLDDDQALESETESP